ncbi:Nucleoside permease NupG [Rhodanobacter lindaniclasticus]
MGAALGLFAFGDPAGGLWMIVLSCIVYGMAFDFFNISGSLFVESQADPKIRASAQGLFMLMTNGIGAVLGSIARRQRGRGMRERRQQTQAKQQQTAHRGPPSGTNAPIVAHAATPANASPGHAARQANGPGRRSGRNRNDRRHPESPPRHTSRRQIEGASRRSQTDRRADRLMRPAGHGHPQMPEARRIRTEVPGHHFLALGNFIFFRMLFSICAVLGCL